MNNVNKTLYIPLYGKAYVSKKGVILHDEKAEKIWDAEGFELKGKARSKWLAYNMGMRSAVFDQWLKQQMDLDSGAVIIHIGCGMDSRVLRVGTGQHAWYDIDFPDVIRERKRYYEESDEWVKEANERADRIEAYIKTQSDTLVDLEEKTTKLERKAEIAEMVYEMARGSGGNEDLRDKLIDVMYENVQLKAENSKLRETLNKAYDFMKQFVIDGRNLLERFLESVGQVVEKVRKEFKR